MITGVIGPDGSGKTTMLRRLAGLLPPSGGVEKLPGLIGYMPQKFGLYERLTVLENLRLYADLYGVPRRDFGGRAEELLSATDLLRFAGRPAGKLSGGMKQKLALACALISRPDALVLDEPTVGVDVLARRELWRIIREFTCRREMQVYVSTTYGDETVYCDRIVKLGEIAPGKVPARQGRPGSRPMIEVAGLVKRFGDFTAVRNISFTVGEGEIFGLLGANGAGKTTTFRMLCGLDAATEGRITVAGYDMGREYSSVRPVIGFMAQKFSLYEDLTLRENLEFFGGAYGLRQPLLGERLRWSREEFKLGHYWRTPAAALPLGIRQRLAMAAALLHRPRVLFLDEATSGADSETREAFWRRIRALADEGVTVVITTHHLEEAAYCDRMIVMRDGADVAQGSHAEILRQGGSDNFEEAFISLVTRREGRS